jgi:hypothetical protein
MPRANSRDRLYYRRGYAPEPIDVRALVSHLQPQQSRRFRKRETALLPRVIEDLHRTAFRVMSARIRAKLISSY